VHIGGRQLSYCIYETLQVLKKTKHKQHGHLLLFSKKITNDLLKNLSSVAGEDVCHWSHCVTLILSSAVLCWFLANLLNSSPVCLVPFSLKADLVFMIPVSCKVESCLGLQVASLRYLLGLSLICSVGCQLLHLFLVQSLFRLQAINSDVYPYLLGWGCLTWSAGCQSELPIRLKPDMVCRLPVAAPF
jgi:hypothetical protein